MALAFIPFFFALSAVSAQQISDHIEIKGPIDAKSVERLRSQITPDAKTLVIESAGGDEASAIEIGKIVAENHLNVQVDTFCLSACAMYVLAGAHEVRVSDAGLVGFHTPALGTAQLMHKISPGSEIFKKMDKIARDSFSLYSTQRKDPKILMSAFYASEVDCIIIQKEQGAIRNIRIRALVDVWVPQREVLEGGGWRIAGYWPTSKDETIRLSKKYLKDEVVVAFGPEAAKAIKSNILISDKSCPARKI